MEIITQSMLQIAAFGTACYVLTFITRKIFETAIKSLRSVPSGKLVYVSVASMWWNSVILYAIAPLYGVGIALLARNTELFPESFRSWQAAVVLGISLGFMSGFIYKVMKKLVLKEVGVNTESELPAVTTDVPGEKP